MERVVAQVGLRQHMPLMLQSVLLGEGVHGVVDATPRLCHHN